MAKAVADRRVVAVENLDDVVREAQRLHERGYDKVGNWDLAQVCQHLADWMTFPMDGFPPQPLPARMMMGVLRATIGRRMLKSMLAKGSMPAGGPTLRETVAPPGGDEAAAIERLRSTVERLKAFQGPLHPSPLFGDQDKAMCLRLHTIHSAHHLGFLMPRG